MKYPESDDYPAPETIELDEQKTKQLRQLINEILEEYKLTDVVCLNCGEENDYDARERSKEKWFYRFHEITGAWL